MSFVTPNILFAPFPYDSKNDPVSWIREIDFVLEEGRLSVKGFVALRETMSNSETGFALFRRGRVIEGSVDEGFRPREILGEVGSPEFKRIFGELHLEGFEVSFTKKGIKWDENMDVFLRLLKEELNRPDFPLLKQARDFRLKPTSKDLAQLSRNTVNSTVKDLSENIKPVLTEARDQFQADDDKLELTATLDVYRKDFEIEFSDSTWLVSVELSNDPAIKDWIEVGSHLVGNSVKDAAFRQVGIRMSINHPFITKYAGIDRSRVEPFLRIAAAMGLAEEVCREAGISRIGSLRLNLNKIMNVIGNSNEK